MCAALTYNYTFDVRSTDRAGFPSAIIHLEIILKFAAAVDPVKRRSVAANAFPEHLVNRFMQRLRLLRGDRIGDRQWIQLCPVRRFIRVNVAETREKALIEQQRFELTVFVVQRGMKPLRCECSAQRFRAELAKHLVRIGRQPDAPELAGIVEDQVAWVVSRKSCRAQAQDQAVMLVGFNCTLFNQEIPAHAQVDQQAEVGEAKDEVLGAARHLFDFLPSDQFFKLSGRGKCKCTGPAQLRVLDHPSE